jgi:hypothetical protein
MARSERVTRPEAERKNPVRNWSVLTQGAPQAAAPPPRSEQEPSSEPHTGSEHGAHLGYRVVDEYLRQGQEMASRFGWDAGAGLGMGGLGMGAGSFQGLSERLVRDGMLWLEHLARLAAPADGQEASPRETSPRGEPAGAGTALAVEVASRLPAEVSLDLNAGVEGRVLGVHDLRAPDPDLPPITPVELARTSGGWRVSVRVGPAQPPARYSGVVFDRESGDVCGTLSVHVKSE